MTAPSLELYGSRSCPHTTDLREYLEWRGVAFTEHDCDADPAAYRRLLELTAGACVVPILVENGVVTSTGWQGRSCTIGAPPANRSAAR